MRATAPLGYAIHKVDAPSIPDPVIEEVATLLDASLVTKESEEVAALWKSQRPAIVVVTTLALGLRKLRAEVRRRVDAWKTLAGSSAPLIHGSQSPSSDFFSPLQSDDHLSTRRRCSFSASFANWAASSGATFMNALRGAIPPRDFALTRIRAAVPFARTVSSAKIE